MKKIINKSVLLILAVFLVSACSSDPELFDKSDSFVAFSNSTVKGLETGNIEIPVMVGTFKGSPSVTVNYEIVAQTGALIAKEGIDFTLQSTSLVVTDGYGLGNIVVIPKYNTSFTGNKTFKMMLTTNSQKYNLGAASEVTVTIVDNEHPLGKWIGAYTVSALSYGDPGNWDESWNVTTTADPSDVNNLLISGLAKGAEAVTAKVDLTTMTIKIKGGASVGSSSYGYTIGLFLGTEDLSSYDKSADIIGTISNDGSIVIDHLSPVITAGVNTGSIWDTFKTEWEKSKD